jgi:predicted nuclease of predicted toxin-antitoxin system
MIRLLTDNDFNNRILRGVLRRSPDFDVIRVQDIGLADASDPEVLAWAADNDRIVVTHDRNTMIAFAQDRVAAGEPMPGLFAADRSASAIGQLIDDLLLIDATSEHTEWAGRVVFLPL